MPAVLVLTTFANASSSLTVTTRCGDATACGASEGAFAGDVAPLGNTIVSNA